ncbi:MAG: 2-amino-4-hydroxy-6-hydroxymethyldihydropteridine diphosphokinase [Polynucleobacter sp.]|nr:2-amino-4-hydroxy-6-hydroxymethyldihydropteridine diphosphokinase [Polynucleobacter sp.]
MAKAFIGFGGNLGDTRQIITDAIVCLALRNQLQIIQKSCFYQSAPVDAAGGDYINSVVHVETELSPYGLLHVCQTIEQQFGRERPYENAPRTLDLDILFFEGVAQGDTELTLPHPRITERSFVLLPLLEIAPDFFLPEFGELKQYLPKVAHQRIEKLACRNCSCEEKPQYRPSAH